MGREAELQQQVMERAQSDPGFRDQLKSDPNAAIKDATGIDIPAEVTITVVEDTPSTIHLVLPAGAGATLSDQELEQVAGGQSSETSCSLGSTCGKWSGSVWGNCH